MLLVGLIDCLGGVAGKLAQRYPSQVTTGEVVALGLRLAALALLRARELLEAAVKSLHLPAHLHGVDDHFPRQVRGQVIGEHPFNAAVCGNQFE